MLLSVTFVRLFRSKQCFSCSYLSRCDDVLRAKISVSNSDLVSSLILFVPLAQTLTLLVTNFTSCKYVLANLFLDVTIF